MNQKHKNNNELEKGLNFESLKEKKNELLSYHSTQLEELRQTFSSYNDLTYLPTPNICNPTQHTHLLTQHRNKNQNFSPQNKIPVKYFSKKTKG